MFLKKSRIYIRDGDPVVVPIGIGINTEHILYVEEIISDKKHHIPIVRVVLNVYPRDEIIVEGTVDDFMRK